LPIIAFSIYHYLRAGTLENLIFWTLRFNFVNGYSSLAAQPPDIASVRLLVLACLLLPAAIFHMINLRNKGDGAWQICGWGLVLLVTSSLTAYPRFSFFHLQPSLPVLAWITILTFSHAWRGKRSNDTLQLSPHPFVAGIFTALVVLWLLNAGLEYQPVIQTNLHRKVWEYTDLVPLAKEIQKYIDPTDSIYIFPDDESTANLYYLMRRTPPKYWVLTYPWFMLDPIKGRIVLALEDHPPKWVIHFPGSWGIEDRAPEVMNYIQNHYQRVTELTWPQGKVWLLERRS
jgi:hypothetical protein